MKGKNKGKMRGKNKGKMRGKKKNPRSSNEGNGILFHFLSTRGRDHTDLHPCSVQNRLGNETRRCHHNGRFIRNDLAGLHIGNVVHTDRLNLLTVLTDMIAIGIDTDLQIHSVKNDVDLMRLSAQSHIDRNTCHDVKERNVTI